MEDSQLFQQMKSDYLEIVTFLSYIPAPSGIWVWEIPEAFIHSLQKVTTCWTTLFYVQSFCKIFDLYCLV